VRAVKIVALVAFLYEVAFNAFLLSGSLGRLISSGDPDALLVTYRLGWSIWPGLVHARGLRIRSKDNNVEFDLRIEQCTFRCVLTDLLRRRFRVTWVTGDGIRFISRLRIEVPEATPRRLDAIPRIEGLEEVPFKGRDKGPPDDAHYDLWTIVLDSVEARGVSEVWIDSFRYAGHADVFGGFMLEPTRWASVGPGVAYFRDGAVTTANVPIATDLRGVMRTTVDGFDPRQTGGAEVLHQASGSLSLDVRIPSVAFVNRLLDGDDVKLTGGAGSARVQVALDHGHLASPTLVVANVRDAHVSAADLTGGGDLDVSLATSHSEGETALEGQLALTKVQLAPSRPAASGAAPVQVDRLEGRLRSTDLDLVDRPLADAALSARLNSAQVPDVSIVEAWLPAGGSVKVLGGAGTVSAALDLAKGEAHGGAALDFSGLRASLGENESLGGAIKAQLELRRWDLATGAIDVSGTRLEVRDLQATGGTEGWWANLTVPSSLVGLRGKTSVRSNLVADARDTRPFVAAILTSAHAPPWLIPVLTSGNLHVTAQVAMAGDRLDVRDLVATAGALRLDGTFVKQGDKSRATALVGCGGVNVALETRDGGTAVQLIDPGAWYQEHARENLVGGP
jgi:hypothetical protein